MRPVARLWIFVTPRQSADPADPRQWKVLLMKIDGGCHCGQIAYEAEIDADKVLICHCTDCQTLSGSAFRTVAFACEGTFKLLAGELKIYIKTSERGTQRAQSFCPECGTPIYSGSVSEGPKTYVIRVGTARQRGELVPKEQHWFRSAQPWVTNLASVRSVETQPPFPQIRQGEMSRE